LELHCRNFATGTEKRFAVAAAAGLLFAERKLVLKIISATPTQLAGANTPFAACACIFSNDDVAHHLRDGAGRFE
jgi:hypothetical protein